MGYEGFDCSFYIDISSALLMAQTWLKLSLDHCSWMQLTFGPECRPARKSATASSPSSIFRSRCQSHSAFSVDLKKIMGTVVIYM